jgi:hypothetical protein
LLLAKSLLIKLGALVDIFLAVLQHPVGQSGEPVSHGRNRLGRSQFGSQAAVLRAQVTGLRIRVVAASRKAVAARLITSRVPLFSTCGSDRTLMGSAFIQLFRIARNENACIPNRMIPPPPFWEMTNTDFVEGLVLASLPTPVLRAP